MARRRIGTASAGLLPCPFLLFLLAGCWSQSGGVSPSDSAIVSDESPWEVSAESPIDRGRRAPHAQPVPGDASFEQPIPPSRGDGGTPPSDEHAPALSDASRAPNGGGNDNPVAPDRGAVPPGAGTSPFAAAADGAGTSHSLAAPGGSAALTEDPNLEGLPPAQQVAVLRAALATERERREALERHLQRLKEETSLPPFGASTVPESELLAAKQEIVDLRRALDAERTARQQLGEQLITLQERLAQFAPADTPEARAQQEALDAAQRAAAANFTRSFTASQTASADLDRNVAAAIAAAEHGDVTTIQAENAALRSRLDEQHRRTQELAEKLKVATRVADLIFKLDVEPSDSPEPVAADPPAPHRAPAVAAPAPQLAPHAPPLPAVAPRPARAPDPPAQPRFRAAAQSFDEDLEDLEITEPDTPTPRVRATRTPTATPHRVPPTRTPTPTPQRRTPVVPAMPVPA